MQEEEAGRGLGSPKMDGERRGEVERKNGEDNMRGKEKEPETDTDSGSEEEYDEGTLEGRIKKRLRWKKKMKQLRDLGRLKRWRKKNTKPYEITLNNFNENRKRKYPSNFISTSKYTWWNFIFKLLFDQFTKISNCYFLLIIIVQFIPGLSPLLPITSILPLVFVVLVAGIKEAIEDFFRHKEDHKNNRKKYDVIRDGNSETLRVASQNIRPGDIVIVKDGKQVPADMLVLATSSPDGTCYITTANLDGETNLKLRKAVEQTAKIGEDPEQFAQLRGKVMCEAPNEHLYHFIGTYCPEGFVPSSVEDDDDIELSSPGGNAPKGKTYPLDEDQLILRGSQLRNTNAVYGLVVYAGKDTKMSLNLHAPPTKHSTVDKILSRLVYSLFVILMIVVVLCAMGSGVWQKKTGQDSWYIDLDTELFLYMLKNVGTYLILLSNFVPISLWVTLELVKVGQAKFMDWDLEMRSEDGKEGMKAKTSSLNEDLGRVQHIFSDKTGTLTENIMKFAKSSVGGVIYEELEPKKKEKKETATETEVESSLEDETENDVPLGALGSALSEVDESEREFHPITHFLRVCSLCHAVVPEVDKKTTKLIYRTPSPDEKALAETAAANGFQFVGRSTETLTLNEFGQEKTYDLLATLPFNADRRRMSVIIREPESEKIYLLIKGGDDVITQRLSADFDSTAIDTNNHHLRKFASEGLRTLVMAYREISEEAFLEFKERFDDAILSLDKEQREILFRIAFDMVENNLQLIGSSAIEDKLQDEVPETISYLLEAGIHIWVVTGDKQETAIEIGHSTRLLNEEMEKVILNAKTQTATKKLLNDYITKFGFREKELERKALKRKSLTWRFWSWFKPKKPTDHHPFEDEDEDELAEIEMEEIEEAKYGTPREYEEEIDEDEEKELKPEQKRTPIPRQHELQLGLIIDGETLKFALRPRLRKDFILLAKNCHAVICCRTSPLQKALVVEAVKKGEKRICLAIGDGANDVSMLQKAHVGVGIFGKEGTQAARASDYAIHQFKHLKKLLCVHGRNSYIRSAGVVQYSFYKNICYNLIFVWFAFYSGFTGQTIFDSWVLGSFNVFFTSLPPLLLGLFERDLNQETIYKNPKTYEKVQSGSPLTFATFSGWMFAAIWHSLVCFFFTYWMFRNDILLTNGQTLDLWCMGEFAGTYIILVILTKVLLESSHWNWIVLLGVAASISFLWLFLIIYAAIDVSPWFTNLYYVFYKCMSAGSFWFLLFVTAIVCLMPDVCWKYVREQYFPESWMILREQEVMEKWSRKRNKGKTPPTSPATMDKNGDRFDMVDISSSDERYDSDGRD